MRYVISDGCVGCTLCSKKCPQKAITGEKKTVHHIDQSKCAAAVPAGGAAAVPAGGEGCGECFKSCPRGAIFDSAGNNNGRSVKKNKKTVASIDKDLCVGCRNCLPNCTDAFAISFSKGRFGNHCSVDELLCLGCQSCAAVCPNGAINMREAIK